MSTLKPFKFFKQNILITYYFSIDGHHLYEINPTFIIDSYRTEDGTFKWTPIKIDFVRNLDEDIVHDIVQLINYNNAVNIMMFTNDIRTYSYKLYNNSFIGEILSHPFTQIILTPENVVMVNHYPNFP